MKKIDLNLNGKYKNIFTRAKVTITALTNQNVTYEREIKHEVEGRLVNEHTKPAYQFIQTYKPL